MSRVGPSRRCLLASLAFLSLSGYLLAGLAPGVGCPNDNPFIVIMKKDGVQLYDTPKRVSSVCKHEFETYGTCCHENQLVAYAEQDKKNIEQDHVDLLKEYRSLVEITKNLKELLEALSKVKQDSFMSSGDFRRMILFRFVLNVTGVAQKLKTAQTVLQSNDFKAIE